MDAAYRRTVRSASPDCPMIPTDRLGNVQISLWFPFVVGTDSQLNQPPNGDVL